MLDGFPRTVAQAEALDGIMAGRDPLIVVDIVVPEAELVRRLSSRMICEDCGAQRAASAHGRRGRARCAAASWCSAPTTTQAVVLRAPEGVSRGRPSRSSSTTASRPTFRSINGAQAPDQVAARSRGGDRRRRGNGAGLAGRGVQP